MPDPAAPHEWCGASTRIRVGSMPYTGPCVLRYRHDGPVHQDANGVGWTDPQPGSEETSAALCLPALRERMDHTPSLLGFYLRLCAWSITTTVALLAAICFTLLPHIGSTTAQLLSAGSAFVGLGTGFAAASRYLSGDTRSKENP